MTTKTERSNVKFPLWRKKVDISIFRKNYTTVPRWVCQMWNLETLLPGTRGKDDDTLQVYITFNHNKFNGSVTCTWPEKRKNKLYRLWFSGDLLAKLKEVFLMSFMRDMEARLQETPTDVESDIPFWEFLDIEFDKANKTFRFTAHYIQKPIFPELFKRLTYSPALKQIDDELTGRTDFRIYKQDWRPRDDYETEIGAENVIYMLMDTKAKLLYIGEAQNLVRRFKQGHPSIKEWDCYRYDQLPPVSKHQRVALERMFIRAFATVLLNKGGIKHFDISGYTLANDRIDT